MPGNHSGLSAAAACTRTLLARLLSTGASLVLATLPNAADTADFCMRAAIVTGRVEKGYVTRRCAAVCALQGESVHVHLSRFAEIPKLWRVQVHAITAGQVLLECLNLHFCRCPDRCMQWPHSC